MKMNQIYRYALTVLIMVLGALQTTRSQDSITVMGVVLSNGDKPVANVSISIEGSVQLPVVTDSTGKFSMEATAPDNWIIVAPTGNYKRKRIIEDISHGG